MVRILILALVAIPVWAQPKAVLIVLDGCRPDYVTPEVMPNVHAVGARGVRFDNHHAVYPTLTRVNSPSIATGCYPQRHGLLGNAIYVPEVNPDQGMSTGNAANLMKVAEATEGALLTVPSLGEILAAHGKTLVAVSAGSSGSALLLNHTAAGGGVINVDLVLPESQRAAVEAKVGPAPEEATPNAARNRWVVDVIADYVLPEIAPDVILVWFSDPDHTAHEHGMGHPVTVESLKKVDGEVGRLLAALPDSNNVLITSDHGFSTNVGGGSLSRTLVEHGLKESDRSSEVIVVDGGIYVREGGPERVRAIVQRLQRLPWVGAIFTKPIEGSPVEGTLPLDTARWHHARSADILVAPQWTDGANEHGFKGTTALPGVATHGNCSPWDIHNMACATGPAFKSATENGTPTGNVDLAPTILRLLEIEPPAHMDGRVLAEALADGPAPESMAVSARTERVKHGAYELVAQWSTVNGHAYLDFAHATRSADGPGE